MTCINNSDIIINHLLKFDAPGDFFVVNILRRAKDLAEEIPEGMGRSSVMLKTYYIYSKDYLQRKLPSIIQLCNDNNARAYILPQRRSTKDVLWELHSKVSDLLQTGNVSIHMDHLMRTSVAGCHRSNRKRWVIDIDRDDEQFRDMSDLDFCQATIAIANRASSLADTVEDDLFIVPTPNGAHVICEPFNLKKAISDSIPLGKGWVRITEEMIKKDAMTLLYAPNRDE